MCELYSNVFLLGKNMCMYFLVKKMCSAQGLREGEIKSTSYLGPEGSVARERKNTHEFFCNETQDYQCNPAASLTHL